MTTFLWWIDHLEPHLGFGEPCTPETLEVYTGIWKRWNQHPKAMEILEMCGGLR